MSAGGIMQMALLGVLFLTMLPLAANPNDGRPMAGMPSLSAAALSASSLSLRRRITTADAAAISESQRRSSVHNTANPTHLNRCVFFSSGKASPSLHGNAQQQPSAAPIIVTSWRGATMSRIYDLTKATPCKFHKQV